MRVVEVKHIPEIEFLETWNDWLSTQLKYRRLRAYYDIRFRPDMPLGLALAMTRLEILIGRNNPQTRYYLKIKKEHLEAIDGIWKEYRYGILSKQLPYDHRRRTGFTPFDWGCIQRDAAKYDCFVKYMGKRIIPSTLGAAFRPLVPMLASRDFKAFCDFVNDWEAKQRYNHFSYQWPKSFANVRFLEI